MLNNFCGVGRLEKDPELHRNGDLLVASFEIGINEFFKIDDVLEKKTHLIPIVCYGRLAEIAGEFLKRGSQIAVRGPLKVDDKKKLYVKALDIEFLTSRLFPEQDKLVVLVREK